MNQQMEAQTSASSNLSQSSTATAKELRVGAHYEVTQNIYGSDRTPSGRKRKRPLLCEKGDQFVAMDYFYSGVPILHGVVGRTDRLRATPEVVAALVEIPQTVDSILERHCQPGGRRLLERLVANGVLTIEQLEAAALEVEREDGGELAAHLAVEVSAVTDTPVP